MTVTSTGSAGVALIASFEGFAARPYNDPVGYATVGYGFLIGYRRVLESDRRTKWVSGQKQAGILTKSEGLELLNRELDAKYAKAVRDLRLPLNQNQFDALVSFVYNVGPGGIGPGTGVGKALRRKDWKAAADHLLDWDKAGGQRLVGLTRRRKAERALFLKAAPVDNRDYLTSTEEAKVARINYLRKAKKNTQERSEIKAWLRARANYLSNLNTKKAHRRERIKVLRDVALNRS